MISLKYVSELMKRGTKDAFGDLTDMARKAKGQETASGKQNTGTT
jgi:hypothetical protein